MSEFMVFNARVKDFYSSVRYSGFFQDDVLVMEAELVTWDNDNPYVPSNMTLEFEMPSGRYGTEHYVEMLRHTTKFGTKPLKITVEFPE